MIVRTNPNIDIPHPTHVTIERDRGLGFFCDTSSINAKFVRCSHSQAR